MHGKNFIGFSLKAEGTTSIEAVNAATGETLETKFVDATAAETAEACALATQAFAEYKLKSGKEKAAFLRAIAEKIVALGDELIDRCHAETALPLARLNGERGRTCGQLNLFATLLEEGSWLNARIDTAQPDRAPLPKSDIRYMERPIGPVAVFGASNFPLAFSTAGGDTASALAAGCPVVVKAHPAHPGSAELVAQAIIEAAKETGMPEGVFSMVNGSTPANGIALVNDPNIKAVGFTGSLGAGRAIYNAAAARPEPIPVYAELGSSNPVFVLPEALKTRGEALATGLSGSVCMGAGQFCTNPGLVVLVDSPESTKFVEDLGAALANSPAGTTVHSSIKDGYEKTLAAKIADEAVSVIAKSEATTDNAATAVQPQLIATSGAALLEKPELAHEVFGPVTLVVTCADEAELYAVAKSLEGQLTTSLQAETADVENFAAILPILEEKCGRIIINEFPTGVEVCSSMMHGGPYPASTDVRSTSVGTAAIHRYTRPVSYQSFPDAFLPAELQNSNPLGIMRLVDGEYTR